MNSNAITRIVILIGGLSIAIVMANMVVTDKASTLMWFGIASVLITGIALGRNIWMLLPIVYGLGFTISIPGRPSTILLGSLIFLAFSSLMLLMRRLPWRGSIREMDVLIFLIALSILQVYLRNPVGVNILGGSSVGARPYVLILIGCVTYFYLSNWVIPPHKLQLILKLTVMGGIVNFVMLAIGYVVPSLGIWYGAVSTVQSSQNADSLEGVGTSGLGHASRVTFLSIAANNISQFISAFRSPLTAVFHPVWGVGIITSFAFAALSGFRNAIISLGLTYIVGIAYRNGIIGLLVSTVALFMSLAAVAVTNAIHPLPPNIQRAFSFLPGTWDEDIVLDAEGSTEWRVEIWKEVMLTDRWIKNKYLGDGLGFSAHELAAQQDVMYRSMAGQAVGLGSSGFDQHRQSILASGDYHSGPIQTIRVVGYVGLAILLLTQFRLAVHAHRQIKRCRNTEWYPLALFIGIPLVWAPFFFVFVFGSFDAACALIFLGAAYVKILENNLPLEPYRKLAPPLPYANPSRHTRSA